MAVKKSSIRFAVGGAPKTVQSVEGVARPKIGARGGTETRSRR